VAESISESRFTGFVLEPVRRAFLFFVMPVDFCIMGGGGGGMDGGLWIVWMS
jgi:hypothetical protein